MSYSNNPQIPALVKLFKTLESEIGTCNTVFESVDIGSAELPRFQGRLRLAKELKLKIKELVKQMDSDNGIELDDDESDFDIFSELDKD